jgi:prepilin-type processing-associated H-X9-DG protein
LLQLGLALGNYASAHQVLPPGVVNDQGPILNSPQGYHYSWTVQILPFIERGNIYRRFNFRNSVYGPSNETARITKQDIFLCPSSPFAGWMNYSGCHHDIEAPIDADNQGVLYLNSHVRYDDVTDGPASTILVGETRGGAFTLGWASGTRATLRNTGSRINALDPLSPYLNPLLGRRVLIPANPSNLAQAADALETLVESGVVAPDFVGGFSSFHPGGANFLFCDGSARLIKQTIDPLVFRSLGNRADGGLISDDQY